jgi:hypothetical protein
MILPPQSALYYAFVAKSTGNAGNKEGASEK